MKMPMTDAKLIEKIGRKHRTNPSSITEPTNVLIVQVTMKHMIVQQNSNHRHPLFATLLTVQVFTKIIHNFKIICPNNIHNKVHSWWPYQPPPQWSITNYKWVLSRANNSIHHDKPHQSASMQILQ